MNHRLTTALGLALALSTGCVGNLGEEGTHVDSVRGTLGEVSVDGTPEVREVRVDGSELFIDLRIQDAYGNWAMFALTIPRDRSSDEVAGSVSLALRPDDAGMVGCSGPDDGDWEFDCVPDDLDVSTEEMPDGTRVDFGGSFTSEGCGDIPYDTPPEGEPFEGSVDVELI
jgi:hypothetical protein